MEVNEQAVAQESARELGYFVSMEVKEDLTKHCFLWEPKYPTWAPTKHMVVLAALLGVTWWHW